ncbi:MAG: MCE family protein [Flammeovirgaceae bacterium]|nr:MAG: MCE family protein [Flammeovirgaceae bacterium]
MENTTVRTIRLGILVTVGAALFTIAVYLIGQKQNMFSQTFKVRAQFNNVSGLQPGNNVRFSGITIGSVTKISILHDTVIEVEMRLKESMRPYIKHDAHASIGTDGLMGNMLVNISPGSERGTVVHDNDLIKTYSPIKTDDILQTLNVTNENAAMLTFDLLEITRQVKRGKGTVASLLYDTLLRNEIQRMARNLRETTEKTNRLVTQISRITTEVNQGRGAAGWLLNDTLTQHQVKATMANLQMTGKKLQAVTDTLQLMLQEIKSGRGTLHTLVYDTAMAGNLKKSIEAIRDGTVKFNETMEAMQRSAFLKKYFKEKEKKK